MILLHLYYQVIVSDYNHSNTYNSNDNDDNNNNFRLYSSYPFSSLSYTLSHIFPSLSSADFNFDYSSATLAWFLLEWNLR